MFGTKLAALAAAVAIGFSGIAHTQEQYPNRLITIVAPITAGTAIDIMARLYADKLSKKFGQQVVVANRAGAGGSIVTGVLLLNIGMALPDRAHDRRRRGRRRFISAGGRRRRRDGRRHNGRYDRDEWGSHACDTDIGGRLHRLCRDIAREIRQFVRQQHRQAVVITRK